MVDAPESIEAWKWNWDLIYTHKIAPAPGAQAQTNPFMSGQVAMVVDGVWWISDFANITDFEWDVALFPKHPKTGKRTTSLESDGWWIFKATKEVDLSWSLHAVPGQRGRAEALRRAELRHPELLPRSGQGVVLPEAARESPEGAG